MQVLLELAPYASLLISLVSFVSAVLLWMARKEFATNGAVTAAMNRADAAHHRIDLLQKDVLAMPTTSHVQKLGDAVGELTAVARELKAEVKSLDDKVDGQAIVTGRIEQHLLNQAAR